MPDQTDEQASSILTNEWVQFTIEYVALVNLLGGLLDLKRNYPALLEGLPGLVELFAEKKSIPQEDVRNFRDKVAKLQSLKITQLPESFDRFWSEILVSRFVDQFELYLTRLLARVLRAYPKALGDSQIMLRDLMECLDIQEAIDRSVEDKVHQLSYAGMHGVAEFMEKQFGVQVDRNSKHFLAVSELIEVRHLIVHRGGLVSRRFLSKTKRDDLAVGSPFPLSLIWVVEAARSLSDLSDEWNKKVYERLPATSRKP